LSRLSLHTLAVPLGIAIAGSFVTVPALAGPAASDDDAVKYQRPSGKIATKNTLDTRVKAAQKQAALERDKHVEMIDAESYAKDRVATSEDVADAQILKLRQLISITERSAPELPELLLRLADLHLEKNTYFQRQADALHEPIYANQQAGRKAKAQQLTAQQKRLDAQARAASGKAVEVYDALVGSGSFAKYKRLDEAIYFQAFELGELGRESEMQTAYLRLLREHPTSQYIPNALLSFADFYYGKNRIDEALALYQKIIDGYPDSPVFAYALYKQGWCYLNPVGTAEPAYAKSLDRFVKTIAATLEGRAGNERNAMQLRRDARRDLVRAFVHAGRPSRAWEFFGTVGDGPKPAEDMSRKMMELLAAAYFGEGQYVESSAIYKQLEESFAGDPAVCDWQSKVVVNALATDDKEIQWVETERLAAQWSSYKDGKHSAPVKKACRNAARDTIAQMATVWHDEADKTRKPSTYALAEQAYRAFGTHFPQDKDAYELGFYYADLLWQQADLAYRRGDKASRALGREKFRAAHAEFQRTLARKPTGKHTRDAAFAQMLALKNALDYDETAGGNKSCKTNTEGVCVYEKRTGRRRDVGRDTRTDVAGDYPETEYTAAEAEMIGAYDVYQKYVKDAKDPELPKIVYHRLRLMMEHNRFAEAEPLAIDLATDFDGTIYSAWAAEMLVDMLTIAWTDQARDAAGTQAAGHALEAWGRKLQTMKLWKHEHADRLRERMPTLLAGIGWRDAIAEQEKGKAGDAQGYKNCANRFVDVWNEFEGHPEGDILLFNAARCFEAALLVGRSIEMRKELLARYPESTKFQQTLKELGEGYQGIALYDKAAASFESYATKYPRESFAPEALNNAYLFRIGLGQQEQAAADLGRYEDIYRKSDVANAARVFWSKHDLLQDDEQRLAHAREYLSTYAGKGGLDRQVVAEATIGQILWRQSCPKSLAFDSCITVKRARATTGEQERKHAEALRARIRRGRKRDTGPRYCGTDTQAIITVHARDHKRADQAMAHFDTVARLAAKQPSVPADDNVRTVAYRDAVGMAAIYAADRKYEQYLALAIPEGLYFGASELAWQRSAGGRLARAYEQALAREQDSAKRFIAWYTKKDALAAELVGRYQGAAAAGSPHWTLAGAARAALVSRNFADQMYRAPVPDNLRSEEQVDAYCDELAVRYGDPLNARAKTALEYCLARSTEFQFFNEFSRMCEQELQQGDAEGYPATHEVFSSSSFTAIRMDSVGVQLGGPAPGTTPRR
jgi:TolA-binding protein